jgi:hypothetical protein
MMGDGGGAMRERLTTIVTVVLVTAAFAGLLLTAYRLGR